MENEKEPRDDKETEEFEVVELESEEGDHEEFVIIDRIQVENKKYAVMALLDDVKDMENMSEEEFDEIYGEESPFVLMRQEEDTFTELADDEFDTIKDEINARLNADNK